MKRKIFICFMLLSIILLSCNRTNDNAHSKELNVKQKKVEQLLQKIKLRTKRDLKRLGIKKILLSNNGVWQDWTEEHIFKKDGRLLMLKDSNILLTQYWKIKNNVLFINPKSVKKSKYYPMSVKAANSFGYSLGPPSDRTKYLRKIKYFIFIKHKIKNNPPVYPLLIFQNF